MFPLCCWRVAPVRCLSNGGTVGSRQQLCASARLFATQLRPVFVSERDPMVTATLSLLRAYT
ncbi:protein of unknown function [Pararobbsia alpina]